MTPHLRGRGVLAVALPQRALERVSVRHRDAPLAARASGGRALAGTSSAGRPDAASSRPLKLKKEISADAS